jgi:hypothetical protein
MIKRILPIVLLAGLLACCGCAPVHSGNYTLASTMHGAEIMGSQFVLVAENATAVDEVPIFFVMMGMPHDYDAMQMILDENGGDVLTNVRVTNTQQVFLCFGSAKVRVSADVWRVATSAELETGSPGDFRTLDQIGDVAYRGGDES